MNEDLEPIQAKLLRMVRCKSRGCPQLAKSLGISEHEVLHPHIRNLQRRGFLLWPRYGAPTITADGSAALNRYDRIERAKEKGA